MPSQNVQHDSCRASSCSRRRFLGFTVGGLGVWLSWFPDRMTISSASTRVDQPNRPEIDRLVQEFMTTYDVPALSIAVQRGNDVLLQAAYGLANRENEVTATPEHQFRIASISKPITSLMIFRLIADGQLQLTDRVFGQQKLLGGMLSQVSISQKSKAQLRQITVQHLLEHTAGGWGNRSRDPMFDSAAIRFDQTELIAWTLEQRPLDHEPGTTYAYSNFGYCLLGRVIERVTGEPYEQAVRTGVLAPAGVTGMVIGKDSHSGRGRMEVTCYGQAGEDPYHRVMRGSRMDAHGGWIASPSELTQLLSRYDGKSPPDDLLPVELLNVMSQPGSAQAGYAKGWSVNPADHWWHVGSFNGAAGILARIHNGENWAVLVNTRSQHKDFLNDLDALPWKIRPHLAR